MIDVIMLTKNEGLNLPYSLPSVVDWARKVFVVDSDSTDRTVEIARQLGAEVVNRPWLGYAAQKNWALDNLPLEADWILILDADEAVLPDLRTAIEAVTRKNLDTVPETGFHVNRYFVFLNKRIRHCGYYPSWNLRFFKRGQARYEDRPVHEHMLVDGPTGFLDGHLEHFDRRGLEDYIAKHNRYSTLEAQAVTTQHQADRADGIEAQLIGGGPLERRRWIKHKLYPRLPFKWFARFVFAYVLKLGFLDGRAGFHFCLFLAAYEHQIQLKMLERKLGHGDPPTAAGT